MTTNQTYYVTELNESGMYPADDTPTFDHEADAVFCAKQKSTCIDAYAVWHYLSSACNDYTVDAIAYNEIVYYPEV